MILLGLLTFKRPRMLERALNAVASLDFPSDERVEMIVMGHPADDRAADIVSRIASNFPIPLEFDVEAERGIARARNKVVEIALSRNADFIAFFDDDEVPDRDWLRTLHEVHRNEGADAVGGPSLVRFPENAPVWSQHLPRLKHRTGKAKDEQSYPVPFCHTNNVLFDIRLVGEMGLRFDERFGLGAGEDQDFFTRARHLGAKIIETPNAVVYETLPGSRLTLRWHFMRMLSHAGARVRMYRFEHGLRATWARYFFRCMPRFVSGTAYVLISPFTGQHSLLRGIKHLADATGTLLALVGVNYAEYKTVHGY